MWLTATLGYWSSLALIGYTYVGYPLALQLLARLRPRPARRGSYEPSVSVVMAARNEAAGIAAKLANLRALDYPPQRLQIVVVSDGSTDGTDEVVRQLRLDNVEVLSLPEPRGKAAALNAGISRARGDVILFCDVRQQIAPEALRALTSYFLDPAVGAVSGELFLRSDRGPGVYWTYEKLIRSAESAIDSVVGATGALYAIRRELFRPLPDNTLLDDVFTPLSIALQGYRVLLCHEAQVFDREADVGGEFARKARTLAGNFQLLRLLPELLNPRRNRLFVQLLSHKLLRLACPPALVLLFCSNVVLVGTLAPGWPFYLGTLLLQLGGYALAWRGWRLQERADRLSRVAHTFVVLNAAAVAGFVRFVRGDFGWTTATRSATAD